MVRGLQIRTMAQAAKAFEVEQAMHLAASTLAQRFSDQKLFNSKMDEYQATYQIAMDNIEDGEDVDDVIKYFKEEAIVRGKT